jgi:hypothetical protein
MESAFPARMSVSGGDPRERKLRAVLWSRHTQYPLTGWREGLYAEDSKFSRLWFGADSALLEQVFDIYSGRLPAANESGQWHGKGRLGKHKEFYACPRVTGGISVARVWGRARTQLQRMRNVWGGSQYEPPGRKDGHQRRIG